MIAVRMLDARADDRHLTEPRGRRASPVAVTVPSPGRPMAINPAPAATRRAGLADRSARAPLAVVKKTATSLE
jgi:hypothetical protein